MCESEKSTSFTTISVYFLYVFLNPVANMAANYILHKREKEWSNENKKRIVDFWTLTFNISGSKCELK